jgi:Mn2+/Fe2+ NRAMP family transporter
MIATPPHGWARVAWLGPGFLWMVSAAGSGELLFTPRVGALHGYTLLWAMLVAIAMKWFINREVGRFAVCTGKTLLQGFSELPGPRGWAVWIVLVPQLFVAVTAIAGLAGGAATALILVLPGSPMVWMIVSVVASTALVVFGKYRAIERAATVIGVGVAIAAVSAAVAVQPDTGELARGLRPHLPPDVDYREILPWLGFMLSGAAGLIWYSYCTVSKGYGAASPGTREASSPSRARDIERLRGWLAQMTFDNTVAVIGTFLIAGAFLILGAELLRPRGLVPEEQRVAATLGRLLGDVWGQWAYWFMVLGVFVGFWDTVLSDQDGHGRMFADGSRLLLPALKKYREATVRRSFVVVLVTAAPIGLYAVAGNPVELLKIAGAIEAAHIPVVTALTLFLNRTHVPAGLRPSLLTTAVTTAAGLFFAAFAAYYVAQLVSGGASS